MSDTKNVNTKNTPMGLLKRWLPIVMIGVAFVAFFASGVHQKLTLDELALRYGDLTLFIEQNFWTAVLVGVITYVVVTAASLPGASLLSIAIGLIFGWAVGASIIVVGATIGASVLYFVAGSLLKDFFRDRAGDKLNVMAAGFREDAVSYMLFLRLAAIFPFFMANIVPAILGVRFSVFFWTTFVGIIPGVIAYAFAGEGLRSIISERATACAQNVAPCGEPFSAANLITKEMLIAFVLLALVSLLPVVLKKLRKKKSAA